MSSPLTVENTVVQNISAIKSWLQPSYADMRAMWKIAVRYLNIGPAFEQPPDVARRDPRRLQRLIHAERRAAVLRVAALVSRDGPLVVWPAIGRLYRVVQLLAEQTTDD